MMLAHVCALSTVACKWWNLVFTLGGESWLGTFLVCTVVRKAGNPLGISSPILNLRACQMTIFGPQATLRFWGPLANGCEWPPPEVHGHLDMYTSHVFTVTPVFCADTMNTPRVLCCPNTKHHETLHKVGIVAYEQ